VGLETRKGKGLSVKATAADRRGHLDRGLITGKLRGSLANAAGEGVSSNPGR
jgi:hypothetical protein